MSDTKRTNCRLEESSPYVKVAKKAISEHAKTLLTRLETEGGPNYHEYRLVKLRLIQKAIDAATAELQAENERLRAVLQSLSGELKCRCDPCWTDRGLHAPDCTNWLAEEAAEAAKGGK